MVLGGDDVVGGILGRLVGPKECCEFFFFAFGESDFAFLRVSARFGIFQTDRGNSTEIRVSVMALSKTEVNLRRLLAAAPQQKNQAKLTHYVATMRELLEQLSLESTPDGLHRVSKAMVNELSEKIEAIASSLAPQLPNLQVSQDNFAEISTKGSPSKTEDTIDQFTPSSPGLRRRHVHFEERTRTSSDGSQSASVKLDSKAHAHIEKHRKLQEDLTDEMVELAQQLKESTLVMSQSLKTTEKILDSTEKAVEQSLASTNRVGARAMAIYSETSKTTCFTWLLMFVMTCVFIMVVLLIRIT